MRAGLLLMELLTAGNSCPDYGNNAYVKKSKEVVDSTNNVPTTLESLKMEGKCGHGNE